MRVQIFGGGTDGTRAQFSAVLRRQCRDLGVPLDLAYRPARADAVGRGVTIVFAGPAEAWTARELDRLQALVDVEENMLPVIGRPTDATFLPAPLRKLNAFRKSDYGPAWAQGLVDEVLGLAWLRRRTRKVFISYKRSDSAAIAKQLFERFTALGFETFLDDVSIGRGTDFQRELKWWLNDADLLLVLLSPNFPNSKWCLEEIAFAQAHSIGVLAVEWPQGIYGVAPSIPFASVRPGTFAPALLGGTTHDQRVRLTRRDFAGANQAAGHDAGLAKRELTRAAGERVVAACTRQRTVAARQRLDNLLLLAPGVLPACGPVRHAAEFGDLDFTDVNGRRCFVRVLPFRPRPESVHEAYADAVGRQVAGCLYAECDVTDARGKALRWLANTPRQMVGLPEESRVWAVCGDRLL